MKTIITIEKEDVIVDGIEKIKRTVKQDDIFLFEDIATKQQIEDIPTKLNMFDSWLEKWRNGEYSNIGYDINEGDEEDISDSIN